MANRLTRANTDARAILTAPAERISRIVDTFDSLMTGRDTAAQAVRSEAESGAETGESGARNTQKYSFNLPSGGVFTMTSDEINEARGNVVTSEAVGEVTGNAFPKVEGSRISERMAEYFKSIGGEVEHDLLGTIRLSEDGSRHFESAVNPKAAAAIKLIATVIKKGQIVDINENHNNKFPSVVIAAKIKIDNSEYFMGVAVRQLEGKDNRYYMHNVLIADANAQQNNAGVSPSAGTPHPASQSQARFPSARLNDPHLLYNILLDLQKRNGQSGQNADSSGKFSIASDEAMQAAKQEHFRSLGAEVDKDGNVTLYHATAPENVEDILRNGLKPNTDPINGGQLEDVGPRSFFGYDRRWVESTWAGGNREILEMKVPARYLHQAGRNADEVFVEGALTKQGDIWVPAQEPSSLAWDRTILKRWRQNPGKNADFSPMTTKQAARIIEESGEIAPTSDARLSLAGEYAAEEFSKDVQEAKRLEAEGETDEEITRKTGCIRGFRGRWWRVLDNSRMRLRDVSAIEPDREYRLDEVYQAEELYRRCARRTRPWPGITQPFRARWPGTTPAWC